MGDRIDLSVLTEHVSDPDRLVAALANAPIVVAMRERTPFPRALLEQLPNLKLLVTTGRANAAIDLAAATEAGVIVSGTDIPIRPTTELAWGLILAVTRNIAVEDRNMRAGGWQHTIGMELVGRTLGVIGLGRQGGRVAAIGRAFKMNVIAWSQNLDHDACREHGIEPVATKEELLERADIVTLHLRLSDRTRGIIGREELARMKPTAYLINTSRGPIIDEPAMLAALRDKKIGGAGLDVFDVEPLPKDHPLRKMDNVVITPHLGYVAQKNYQNYFAGVVEDIRGFIDGKPVRVMTA